jgi:serine/threonine protein kinase
VTAGFAGFTCLSRLSVDPYGELWAATGPGGEPAQLRRIDARLAHLRPFASALLKHGERLTGIEHPNLVATIAVGHDEDDALVLVQADHGEQVSLETVLKDARLSGVHASAAVALYIVRQVVKALARVHRAGVAHGGVHPRSVLIDRRGEIRLADTAVARALAAAATQDDTLLSGLLGYVAPEIALGDEPGARSDVFSAGALLTELCTGAPAPGLLEGPPALIDAAARALHTDPDERFADATELSMALDGAASQLEQDPDARAVARFVTESHGGANRSLEAETENLLAGLDLIADVSVADLSMHEEPSRTGFETGRDHPPLPPPVPRGRDDTRPSDSWRPIAAAGAAAAADPAGVRMPDLDASLLGAGAAQMGKRKRDSAPMRVQTADVISEQLVTPGPMPAIAPTPRPQAAPLPLQAMPSVRTLSPTDETMMAPPVLSSRPASPSSGASGSPRASRSAPFAAIPPISELTPPHPPGHSRTLWLVAVVSVALVGLLIWKSGILNPRQRSDEELAARDQLAAAARGAEVSKTRYADVVIDSDVAGAAVWMNLGKTPVDSLPLSSAGIYELRVQQDGMKASDVVVTPARWSGAGEAMNAAVKVALEPAPGGYVAPAAPPHAPASQEVAAAKSGRGRIHVDSDPPGAHVWLLVGFTPAVRVQNLAADRNHEFKVMLDGRVPAFAEVLATDFMDPSGQVQKQVHEVKKSVVLRPRPRSKDDSRAAQPARGKDRK